VPDLFNELNRFFLTFEPSTLCHLAKQDYRVDSLEPINKKIEKIINQVSGIIDLAFFELSKNFKQIQ
jgi:hypothetical protein